LARILALLYLLVFAIAGPVAAQMPSSDPSLLTLRAGDVIRIEVWRNKELSGDFPIASDGSITHPLYRELKVTGLPLVAIEEQLRRFLARYDQNPTFVISPLLRVVVAGEVRQPNIYTVPPGTAVAQVIAIAGGATERGRLDKVQLVRQNASRTIDITRPEATASSTEVHSGDEIIVGRRRSIMQDVVAPSSSILAALAAVTTVILQVSK
jgi:polysaccharide biosynthesis/export protein